MTQFKELTTGTPVYVLIKGDELKYNEGCVVTVGPVRTENPYTQSFDFTKQPVIREVVDITYTVGDKNVTDTVCPTDCMASTDKFGSIALLATDKQSIVKELRATLNTSEKYLNDIDKYQKRVEQCKDLISQLDTEYNEKRQFEQRLDQLNQESAEMRQMLKSILNKLGE